MVEKYLEENRFLYIETKLGPNRLLLESFTGQEGLSELFSFQLELLSEDPRIPFEAILGQEISFGVLGPEGSEPRPIHGLVTAFAQLPASPRLSRYRAVVSPKLWIHTKKQDCRIFQNLTTLEILKKVLAGINVSWELQNSYQPRDYCVQYRETDYDFAYRLMQEEGMFYFFRHSKTEHKMVIADNKTAHRDLPGESSLVNDEVAGGLRDEACISNWTKIQHLSSGKLSLRDYSFLTPQTDLTAGQEILPSVAIGKINHSLKVGGNDRLEIYDYPGLYEKKAAGQDITKHGMEQLETAQFAIHGESNCFNLIPGYRFTLNRHPNADGAYVVSLVNHRGSEGGFHSTGDIGNNEYANTFHSIPFTLLYRPPQPAARPRVLGCQTAVVVGPAGEEIYADKYGRIKVQFHWDREGKKNDSSSCWIRIASFWAGKNWGGIHIPRIGQEVVVDFLEGNPDRPIIVGSVYNALNMPPYDLPSNKTQSGLKSESSKGAGGNNEIRFEDLKGREEIFVHAQKDMNTKIENDETRQVGHDRSTTINHDQTVKISNNRTTEVGVNETAKVGKDMNLTIGSNCTLKIGGNDSETIGGSQTVTIGGSESHTVGGSCTTKIASSNSLLVGGTISVTASGVTITAPTITLNTSMLQVTGVVQCMNVIASVGVVSPSYTPGAGNMI